MDVQIEPTLALERRIGRLLIGLTYLSVVLLVVGVGLMAAAGISPLAGGPALDLANLADMIGALDPAGFLWIGLLVVIGTPISQVCLAAVAYARTGDGTMVGITVAILAIMLVAVVTAGIAIV